MGHYKDLTETWNRARKVFGTQGSVVMAASESFERALKESISNLLEGFDGVDKLSDEQTSGVLNFIQRN